MDKPSKQVFLVDLSREEYAITKEISAMNELNDPEKYVITGLENLIIPNNSGSSYFFKTNLYNSFCELDFVEMRRLSSQS